MPTRQYWLVKTEPNTFSFDNLLASPKKTSHWDGVRNYAARNHLRSMKTGDLVFVYHSSVVPSAIVGVAEVVREAYPDPTALDPKDPFPKFHGQGGRLHRAGDSMPRVSPVAKLAITHATP